MGSTYLPGWGKGWLWEYLLVFENGKKTPHCFGWTKFRTAIWTICLHRLWKYRYFCASELFPCSIGPGSFPGHRSPPFTQATNGRISSGHQESSSVMGLALVLIHLGPHSVTCWDILSLGLLSIMQQNPLCGKPEWAFGPAPKITGRTGDSVLGHYAQAHTWGTASSVTTLLLH